MQFTRLVRAGLTEKVTAEQRLEGSEGLAMWHLQQHQCPKWQHVRDIVRATGGGGGDVRMGESHSVGPYECKDLCFLLRQMESIWGFTFLPGCRLDSRKSRMCLDRLGYIASI